MQSISVFLDTNFANFGWENADVSRIYGDSFVIYMFFGSSSDKVQLCQVASLQDMRERF